MQTYFYKTIKLNYTIIILTVNNWCTLIEKVIFNKNPLNKIVSIGILKNALKTRVNFQDELSELDLISKVLFFSSLLFSFRFVSYSCLLHLYKFNLFNVDFCKCCAHDNFIQVQTFKKPFNILKLKILKQKKNYLLTCHL